MAKNEVKLCDGSSVKLEKGLRLFCPSHGVGEIEGTELMKYLGEDVILCRICFKKDKMNLMLPIARMKEMGVRSLSSRETMNKILKNVFSKPSKISKGSVWSKLMIEYETKLNSGSALLIAEVIKELFPNKERSYSEMKLLERAVVQFEDEYSAVFNITLEEARRCINDALSVGYPSASLSKIDAVQDSDSDFEDEVESYNEEDEDSDSEKSSRAA